MRLPAALLTLTLAACPRPLRFGPEGEIRDPRAVLARLDARSARLRSVRGEARVRLRSPSQLGTASELVAAERPARLHLTTLGFFGKPAASLASDGAEFQLFVEQTASFYAGPATAANVSHLLLLELPPASVVDLLLGDVPRLSAREATMALEPESRAYRLSLAQGVWSQELWVATEDLSPLRSQIRGPLSYDAAFGDFEDVGELRLPRSLELRAVDAAGRPTGVELGLHYREREANVELDPSLFRLKQPPGTKRIELDADGRPRSGEPAPPARLPLPSPPASDAPAP
jgi:hypothetical protein